MSDSRDDRIKDFNPGKVPLDSFDVETKLGLMHVDTYDLDAAKRYQAERAQCDVGSGTNPLSAQNRQHSGK